MLHAISQESANLFNNMRWLIPVLAIGMLAAEEVPQLTEATRALYRGDLQHAQDLAHQFLQEHPSSSLGRILLARTEMARGDVLSAYRDFEQVVRRDPKNTDALYYFGKLCGMLSQAEYQRLYALAPDSARVHQLLGESYQAQDDLPKAEEEFLKALHASPRSVRVLTILGDLKRLENQAEDAASYYRQATEINPRDYDANYGLGATYLYRQDPDNAIGWFRRALAAEPDSFGARLALGDAYLRAGKMQAAVAELKIVAQSAQSSQAYALLGRAYQRLGQAQAAAQAFATARQLLQATEHRP